MVRVVTVPFLNFLPEGVIKLFMRKTSRDASVVVAKGGTTHALEAMYGRSQRKLFSRGILQGIADIFWHHIVSQPKSLRNRLKIVQKVMGEKIIILLKARRDISILSIAGGSSRSIMYTLQSLRALGIKSNIRVVTIDKDITALDVGKRIANELKLQDCFEWVHGTASQVSTLFPNKKFDMVEIVGLLDYFDFARAVRLISLSKELLNEGGFIIIANVMPNSEKPFVHKTGWPAMYYRTPEETRQLLVASGFVHSNEVLIEPLNIHCVCVGQK